MATLKDVAALAHVDVSTVSRALNNSSYVHPDTKARVMAAVKELSYKPNVLARGLRHGKLNTIAIVIPKINYSIFSHVAFGVEKEAQAKGYAVIMVNTGNDGVIEKESLNKLRNSFIDGMIIASTGSNKRLIRDINTEIPVVQFVRCFDPNISCVDVNYTEIGYKAVYHLYEKGCRRIAIINASIPLAPYMERYTGYKRALSELGLEEIAISKESLLQDIFYGYECTLDLLDKYDDIDAVLMAGDAQAMGALRALKERKISVPEQIKVMSMTGTEVGSMLETSLTAFELPEEEIGSQAALMLIRAIEAPKDQKPSVQHLTLSARLEERESTM
ncbi:LacI family DNA-binding transcriptional regulator [Oribacterium sp. FC2011]|uniref:LacI family DNA-binding transcriptional regulator n=1 Tax=Oribacterium sp. FC2011 TaxID=1408311 RepID=UPI0004E286C0|nr:LacI family DNA-binding transcriptional regulator [Oribacterium sp. FC2011]